LLDFPLFNMAFLALTFRASYLLVMLPVLLMWLIAPLLLVPQTVE